MSDPALEAEITQRIEDYLEQLTSVRDLESAADFYTKSTRLIGPDTDMGHAEMVESLRAVFEGGIEVQVNRQTIELFPHGNAAYELARAEDVLINPDGSTNTMRNNLFIRWVRGTDGKWRFDRVLLSPQTIE